MIEKLDIKDYENKEQLVWFGVINKLNALIDAVNKLQLSMKPILEERKSGIKVYEEAQDMYDNAILDALKDKQVDVVVESAENVQDEFAEQRRWIGCVCRFWYDNPNDTLLDYLEKIQTGKNGVEYYSKESGDWFPHCEPVLPDSELIYHGE